MISYFVVKGQSMEPYCGEGDFVISVPYFFSCLKAGDIVVLQHPKSDIAIVKRITSASRNGYWVQGDNKQESSDSRSFGWIPRKSILGRAKVIHRPHLLTSSIIK